MFNNPNFKLLYFIIAIALVVEIRLLQVANDTGNWAGFFYSSIHTLIVAVASYLAIRPSKNKTI